MEIDYKGANCVVIKDKNALIIVDPTPNATVKDLQNPEAVVLATQPNFAPLRIRSRVLSLTCRVNMNIRMLVFAALPCGLI